MINSGGCFILVYSKVCDFLVLFSDGSRTHEQHSTCVEFHNFFLSSMRSSQTVILAASNCLALFLNALMWSSTLPSQETGSSSSSAASGDSESASFPADMMFSSTSMSTSSRNLAAWLTWLNCSFFADLDHATLAGTVKETWHFPPSKWAPLTQVFGVSGGIFQRIFTIHSLRCYSFAGSRWTDSSPLTVLASLHPPLPLTPQRRRSNNCTSALGKSSQLHNFF